MKMKEISEGHEKSKNNELFFEREKFSNQFDLPE